MDDLFDAEQEAGFKALHEEFKPNIIADFQSARMSSYYEANPTLL